ncbi:Highly reducing polyketide synthase ACRTS2 [Apiospora kogelbergensis]|uniref:Highly reducing polyketide synthase ACRTS2 n=1 Tax=Apiospora kogelbergensis TaxID=1337665 RepID=UPI00312EEBF6
MNAEAIHHPSKAGFFSSNGGHFLPDDIYAFDSAFFSIKTEEAKAMDPQHRLLLEMAFEAMESAGLTLPELAGSRTGVFTAHDIADTTLGMLEDLPTTTKYSATGVAPVMAANRLSYFFDLTGPSVTLDAACAGSAYAIHVACKSLLEGDCSVAFVNAAKLLTGPGMWSLLVHSRQKEKSFSYDSRASGFGKGEGGACLIIKRLSDARACGDPVRAVIRNTAVSHSGRSNGITMPSRTAQEDLLLRLHREVGLDPNDTGFVEGHGTGTEVGDPIDAGAVSTVIGSRRSSSNPVYIGSIKSNFGHLEGASGAISVVKAIMMLERKMLLPNADFIEMNPKIEHPERLKVLTKAIPWPLEAPRRVVVTNFGFGGSNAAVLLDEEPKKAADNGTAHNHTSTTHSQNGTNGTNGTSGSNGLNGYKTANGTNASHDHPPSSAGQLDKSPDQLFVFSSKSLQSLSHYTTSVMQYLDTTNYSATDISYTLGQRRTHFPHSFSVVANSIASLKSELSSLSPSPSTLRSDRPKVAFIFTGQGAQYAQMASGLGQYLVFSDALRRAEKVLHELGATWSLKDELAAPKSASRIDTAEISQPACTAIQLALVLLLRSWRIVPMAVLGHSSGEIAAAFSADLVTFESAMAIAYFRGVAANKLIEDDTIQGAMLAVGAGPDEAASLLKLGRGYATIAAVNSPGSVTISGDVSVIDRIENQAREQGFFVRRLKVRVAYHSRHMELVADEYIDDISPRCDTAPSHDPKRTESPVFISSVTGIQTKNLDASYWARNLVQPVEFMKAVEQLVRSGASPDIIVELGPHSALKTPIMQVVEQALANTDQQPRTTKPTYFPSLVRDKETIPCVLALAGKLFSSGVDVNLGNVNSNSRLHQTPGQVVRDFPAYEWNKSARFEHTNRFMQQKIKGGRPYNDVIGWKSPYSEGSEHAFRNVFTLDEKPWIRDHCIDGDSIFPMAGFLSMAVEAFNSILQQQGGPPNSHTVVLREFHVFKSLVVEEDQPVDVTTKLRPHSQGTLEASTVAWKFEILSWSKNQTWVVHSCGILEADEEEALCMTSKISSAMGGLSSPELQERDVTGEYDMLESNGTKYGPSFRIMTRLREAPGGLCVHTVRQDLDVNECTESGASQLTLDAPLLDSLFHALGIVQGRTGPRPTFVPISVRQWRMSKSFSKGMQREYEIVSRLSDKDDKMRTFKMDIIVFDRSSGSLVPVVEIDTMELKAIIWPEDVQPAQHLPQTCFLRHVPYVGLYPGNIMELQERTVDQVGAQNRLDMDSAGLCFLARMLQDTDSDDMSKMPFNIVKFRAWAKSYVSHHSHLLPSLDEQSLIERISDRVSGRLLCAVGERLTSVVRGEVGVLEIMLTDHMLERSYEQDPGTIICNDALARYVGALAACKPDMNILEIGGGTGSATLPSLLAIDEATEGSTSFFKYTFTDISSGFFENTGKKLQRWSHRMTYKKLDISQDPVAQGFQLGSYDLIIASNVLHATQDITATLKNTRSLLKPNGKLGLVEITRPTAPCAMHFATLPGWWLSVDEYRTLTDGPLMSKDTWNRVLSATGFSGLEMTSDDYPDHPAQFLTALWSTRREDESSEPQQIDAQISICLGSSERGSVEFADRVSSSLERSPGHRPPVQSVLDIRTEQKPLCVFIDGPQRSMLTNPTREEFDALKAALINASSLLWVFAEDAHPDTALIKGLLRTLRLEDSQTNFVLLDNVSFDEKGAKAISDVVRLMQDPHSDMRREQEFLVVDGMVHVPRLVASKTAKEAFSIQAGNLVKAEQRLGDSAGALEMTVDAVGSLEAIYFRHGDALRDELAGGDIVVRVSHVGVSARDLQLLMGAIPWHAPGEEGVGEVVRVGRDVRGLAVGDRVLYITPGAGLANFARVPAHYAHRVPDGLASAAAATMPVAYSTAIHCLEDVARLRRGESVLVHAATGGVGQACIMMAQHLGAEVFATAGTPEKREFLSRTFGIATDHVFSSRNSSFKSAVLLATSGRGVDVVVNSLSDHLLQHSWEVVAEHGTFVEIGKKDILKNNFLPMRQFDKNITFAGVEVRRTMLSRPEMSRSWFSRMTELAAVGAVQPIHGISHFGISDVISGLRKLRSGQNIGKVVVSLGADERVLAEQPRLRCNLRPDATYVISGGTGGIGRSVAQWMTTKGAKNIVLLGRSAASNPEVAELLQKFQGTDIQIRALPCDIGDRGAMERVVRQIQDLPRVRGVMHGALTLSDSFFANATYEDWKKIMGPKLNGAWNLHELFTDLDFFVSLSSVEAIGCHVGQSIYSGTSTFLDAFSAYRIKRGLPAVTISLPVVEDVGYVADRGILERLKESLGIVINESHVHTLVEAAIIGPSSGINNAVDGRSFSFLNPPTRPVDVEFPWDKFHWLAAMRIDTSRVGVGGAAGAAHEGAALANGAERTEADMMRILCEKISAITMIELEEITPTRSLDDYGIDSLVSVEFRNWIKREFGVDLALKAIVAADNLEVLRQQILSV